MSSRSNAAIGVSQRPTFLWSPSPGTASYRLQVSTDASFGTLVVDQPGITTTSATLIAPLVSFANYFWRVVAESTHAVTAIGAPFSFTTLLASSPGSFAQASPARGAISVPLLPTFRSTTIDPSGITATSETPSILLPPLTTTYWRITARNGSNHTTATPSPLLFTTQ